MTPRRVTIETTMYGKRLVTYAELLELHREVSRAASVARLSDPEYVARKTQGDAIARMVAERSREATT